MISISIETTLKILRNVLKMKRKSALLTENYKQAFVKQFNEAVENISNVFQIT